MCENIDLNQFVHTDADRDCLFGLLELSRNPLQRFGSWVPGDYLNRIVDAQGVLDFVDRPTSEVLAAFDKFTGLLTEK